MSKKSDTQTEKTKTAKVNQYKLEKEEWSQLRKLKNSLERIEKEIEKKEKEISDLENKLLDPEIATDYTKAAEFAEKLAVAKNQLDLLLNDWERINLELEEKEEV